MSGTCDLSYSPESGQGEHGWAVWGRLASEWGRGLGLRLWPLGTWALATTLPSPRPLTPDNLMWIQCTCMTFLKGWKGKRMTCALKLKYRILLTAQVQILVLTLLIIFSVKIRVWWHFFKYTILQYLSVFFLCVSLIFPPESLHSQEGSPPL